MNTFVQIFDMPRFFLLLVVLVIADISAGIAQHEHPNRGILPEPITGLVSTLNDSALSGAHIINMNLEIGTISDDSGHFILPIRPGDSVFASHIGFFPRIVTLKDRQQINGLVVYLLPQTTELSGVTIYALPSTYLGFKRAFINIKLPTEVIVKHHIPPPGPTPLNNGGFGISFSGPIQALYDAFSKEARQKKALSKLLATDHSEKIRNSRINDQTIKMLTGITDAETIERFRRFCQIDNNQITSCNDYELFLAILDCYRFFRANNY